jgi:predicted dinucleotide-binding enzyme
MKKTIGILGSGGVAKTLAKGFIALEHRVILGTRSPGKLHDFVKENPDLVKVTSFEDAARQGDLLILAVNGTAAESLIASLSPSDLENKTIIDPTNPIKDTTPEEGVLAYFTDLKESLMERLQNIQPKAHFVKAFSCVGEAHMVNPSFPEKPSMFICGNNPEAKKEVQGILHAFGWEVEDMGSVQAARAIEPLCILICIPGFLNNSWNHAFKLLKTQNHE